MFIPSSITYLPSFLFHFIVAFCSSSLTRMLAHSKEILKIWSTHIYFMLVPVVAIFFFGRTWTILLSCFIYIYERLYGWQNNKKILLVFLAAILSGNVLRHFLCPSHSLTLCCWLFLGYKWLCCRHEALEANMKKHNNEWRMKRKNVTKMIMDMRIFVCGFIKVLFILSIACGFENGLHRWQNCE